MSQTHADRTRSIYEIGPALFTHGALAPFYSKSGGTVALNAERFDVGGDMTGPVDARLLYSSATLNVQPDGRISTNLISTYWPHLNTRIGASLFGSTAKALVALCNDGAAGGSNGIHTIHDAAVTGLPDLVLSTNKDTIGSMSYTGVTALSKKPGEASSIYTAASTGTYAADSTFAKTDYKQGVYLLTFGAYVASPEAQAKLDAIEAEDGWTVSFEMQTQNIVVNGVLRDIRLTGIRAMIKGTPANASSAALAALEKVAGTGAGITPGESADAAGDILSISGGGVTVTAKKAFPVSAGFRFGSQVLRPGEIGFLVHRTFSSGVVDSDWLSISIA